MPDAERDFSDDLLRGADKIAGFLFGDVKERRKVYHLAGSSKLPVFKMGSMICARKSVLVGWVKEQEMRHANDNRPKPKQ